MKIVRVQVTPPLPLLSPPTTTTQQHTPRWRSGSFLFILDLLGMGQRSHALFLHKSMLLVPHLVSVLGDLVTRMPRET